MNPLFSTALGGCVLLVTAAAFSAETLVHASNWETLSYEAQQFPQEAPSPWAYASAASTNGTRQIVDGEILDVNTMGANGYHRYRKEMPTVFDRLADGYLISVRLAIVSNETTIASRNRTDAAFNLLISDAVGSTTGQTYFVGIDAASVGTGHTADGALRTNVTFSSLFAGYNARTQNVYTIKRTVADLSVYVNGQLLFRDEGFESTSAGPTTKSVMEFGDRATNYDCEFAVDYIRGGQAYLPPPSGTIILLN